MAEVPVFDSCRSRAPSVTEMRYSPGGRGRPRQAPRLSASSPAPRAVRDLLALRDQAEVRYYVKDGEIGPLVWEAKQMRVTMNTDAGMCEIRLHLVVARNVLNKNEVKFFVSNAPTEMRVETLLVVACSRWRVE